MSISVKDLGIIKEQWSSPVGKLSIWNIGRFEEIGFKVSKLPISIRILLESVVRNYDGRVVKLEDIESLLKWDPKAQYPKEIPFIPARLILQDFTGVPLVADLAAMRDAVAKLGKDPKVINPLVPVDLVIDHSVQVDYFGVSDALRLNMELEFERNRERYVFLKWAQSTFSNFKVVPPGKGIIHQVNIEYLAKVVFVNQNNASAYPDTVLGTDSHTTMVSGIGVLGWGVGGIEAEAVMLGQPHYITIPQVVGVKLVGEPREGVTATDIVLNITEFLRKRNVVGKIVEYYGPGIKALPAWDRVTVSNMAPEYGATTGLFPVDELTLSYLRLTGRDEAHVKLVEDYLKHVGLFYTDDYEPVFSESYQFDLSEVEPVIAGPRNPDEKIPLKAAKATVSKLINEYANSRGGKRSSIVDLGDLKANLTDGAVAIAAITSCTNTSNPTVLIGAGLMAKKAVEKGLRTKPWVKTSLAPGSRVVTDYLTAAGLMPYLEALGFHVTGYGCTVCIGNTGPLPEPVAKAIRENDVYTVAVLSGNRNYEGRIHPLVKAAYLASPMLVVAYALAGRIDVDFDNEPLGYDPNGKPVYLRDIWPSISEVNSIIRSTVVPELFKRKYADVYKGDELWEGLKAPSGLLYQWDPSSTYIRRPPFFDNITPEPPPLKDIKGARILLLLGDKITTDHISPAGSIPLDSPAAKYLIERGVKPEEFNTYGARRGNHEVMVRGGFSNIKLKNFMVNKDGGYTIHWPDGKVMTVYEAAVQYQSEGVPLVIFAGKQYGSGSSRDWAAKATLLLGVKAVIAESFERIHRSNLVDMGVLPIQLPEGVSWRSLGLTGNEVVDVIGIEEGLEPRKRLKIRVTKPNGEVKEVEAIARLDNEVEVEYYKHGGILPYMLRRIALSDGR
ncbi:aconitate hydratase AcnA [Caldivirga maquilingensis]|uniref:aconitate hydratase n=1 Tax=Caldivirga maquilingensis (strain ATCC 700844 / DSM 13496 / JCM 10307 / IC-167) TaxID=397948 RepID=A8MCG1_CALMQ|nr:aconitate hydratase AcnA [Caldivirga maquilingensis]ABW01467.1 aconitate hydratase 1 [Caldivirga maquilingensis IC-167]